jgi:hypothetical protein
MIQAMAAAQLTFIGAWLHEIEADGYAPLCTHLSGHLFTQWNSDLTSAQPVG